MEHFFILFKYAFLGLVQGITEPIPISSSGHLIIMEHLLGLHIKGLSFEVFVNTASLLAVLVIYKNDIIRLTRNGTNFVLKRDERGKDDFHFILYLVIGTIPAAMIGMLLNDWIAGHFKTLRMIGWMLLVTGIALWLIRNMKGRKNDGDLTMRDALIVGMAQAVALFPGLSRSGSTIVAAMGLGMKQQTALRFSFLLYIPISFAGIVLELPKIISDPYFEPLIIPYMVSFLICFLASYFSLKWFMGIMARGNLGYFTVYCLIAGTFVLLVM